MDEIFISEIGLTCEKTAVYFNNATPFLSRFFGLKLFLPLGYLDKQEKECCNLFQYATKITPQDPKRGKKKKKKFWTLKNRISSPHDDNGKEAVLLQTKPFFRECSATSS